MRDTLYTALGFICMASPAAHLAASILRLFNIELGVE